MHLENQHLQDLLVNPGDLGNLVHLELPGHHLLHQDQEYLVHLGNLGHPEHLVPQLHLGHLDILVHLGFLVHQLDQS